MLGRLLLRFKSGTKMLNGTRVHYPNWSFLNKEGTIGKPSRRNAVKQIAKHP